MTKFPIINSIFSSLFLVLFFTSCRQDLKKDLIIIDEKIVTLNGTFSEILYNLGLAKNILAVDSTSNYPDSAKFKTNIGFIENIDVKRIEELSPNRIVAFKNSLNPELIDQFKKSNLKINLYEELRSIEDTKQLIKAIADTFHRQDKGLELIQQIDDDLKDIKIYDIKPKVLFIYVKDSNSLKYAGKNTTMSYMIEVAGGINAANEIEGLKSLTKESLIAINPDVILMFNKDLKNMGGLNIFNKIKGLEMTNAGKNKAIIEMDEQLLSGFGVRVGRAVVILNKKLSVVEINVPK